MILTTVGCFSSVYSLLFWLRQPAFIVLVLTELILVLEEAHKGNMNVKGYRGNFDLVLMGSKC